MTKPGGIAGDQLRSIIERVEFLNEVDSNTKADKAEVFKEARSAGFDAKAIRRCIRARTQDVVEREEDDAIFELYMRSLGEDEVTGRDLARINELVNQEEIAENATVIAADTESEPPPPTVSSPGGPDIGPSEPSSAEVAGGSEVPGDATRPEGIETGQAEHDEDLSQDGAAPHGVAPLPGADELTEIPAILQRNPDNSRVVPLVGQAA